MSLFMQGDSTQQLRLCRRHQPWRHHARTLPRLARSTPVKARFEQTSTWERLGTNATATFVSVPDCSWSLPTATDFRRTTLCYLEPVD